MPIGIAFRSVDRTFSNSFSGRNPTMSFVYAVLAILALTPQARVSPAEPTVVFVCEHGAAKSVIATAYFNKIAAERGLRARAIYRGTNPQPDLSVRTIKGLQDDGLRVPEEKPSAITSSDVDAATVIFAIGCTLPTNASASGKSANWDDVPEDSGYGA